ncbi:MAG: DUF924 domain-containing protein [Simkaniaceae bacterium]|nr:MAG: DUF924 domain-containing protein [Simkaniaceae bacterium]
MIEEILEFWFGKIENPEDFPVDRLDLWFKKDEAVDTKIKQTFGHLLEEDLKEWDKEVKGRLAHLLILDQFSRHIHRGKPESFHYDPQSLALVIEGLGKGMDQELLPVERAFFYMPLQHIEDPKVQDLSVKCYKRLFVDAPESVKSMYHEFYKYALRHQEPIATFGRFPHRNSILGRTSSTEEEAYLKKEGSF